MAASSIPTSGSPLRVDTAATANSVPQRDGTGGVLHTVVTASSGLVTQGTIAEQRKSITATQTVDATATAWFVAAAAAVVLTLPSAATCDGRRYSFLKTDASGFTVTITPAGVETINGAATKVLSTQFSGCTIQSDGTNWFIVP